MLAACAIIGRPVGIPHIQHAFADETRSVGNKENFFPLIQGRAAADPMGLIRFVPPKEVALIEAA